MTVYRFTTRRHVHEFLFSTRPCEGHDHQLSGSTTQEAILLSHGGHLHRFKVNTDFQKGHCHQAAAVTGRNIDLKDGRHIHYVKSFTSFKGGHRHRFQGATLIQNPPANTDGNKGNS